MRILIVEDEVKLAYILKEALEEEGFQIDLAHKGSEAKRKVFSEKYDLIIVDIILPELNGIELCKIIRKKDEDIPIIMLTALGTTEDKLAGFDSGADDYLIKPFEFRELLARIKARTKKIKNKPQKLTVKDLTLNYNDKSCTRGGKNLKLTIKEFSLLEYFILNKNRVIPRSELAEKVWNINFDTGTNIVDVYVNYLRKKIDKDFDDKLIKTHVGIGYILKAPENED